MRQGIRAPVFRHALRRLETVIKPQKRLSVRVEPIDRSVHSIKRIMVTSFTIFGLMINDAALHLHLPGRKIALEILHVGRGVPQTPLHEREQFEFLSGSPRVGKAQTLQFTPISYRHEKQKLRAQTVFLSGNASVTHSMTALISIERSLARFPAGIPYGIPVFYVKIPPAVIHRHAIITVARNSAEFGITTEAIPAGGS